MKILFAVKVGDPPYLEQVITEKEERIEQAKQWAIKNGFDRLRVAEIDNRYPDFIQSITVR